MQVPSIHEATRRHLPPPGQVALGGGVPAADGLNYIGQGEGLVVQVRPLGRHPMQSSSVLLLTGALPGMPVDADDAPSLLELLTSLTATAERAA
jgi:hypothetical protein